MQEKFRQQMRDQKPLALVRLPNRKPTFPLSSKGVGGLASVSLANTFIKGNEVYAGQKANGTIARILKDHTWSEKYQKVVPHKGRYALLFQDPGGGGQVIAFAPEQLEKALSDLKQQGYEQLVGTKPTTMFCPLYSSIYPVR